MKQKIILLSFLLTSIFSLSVQAQSLKVPTKVPVSTTNIQTAVPDMKIPGPDFSKDLLKALSPGKGLGISPDKLLKLNNGNSNFVGKVMDILGGSGSNSDKLNLFNSKKAEHKDFIEKLLGKSKAAEYYKVVKKQLEKLSTKYAIAKLFM